MKQNASKIHAGKKLCRKKLEPAVKEIDVVKMKVDEKLDGTNWV